MRNAPPTFLTLPPPGDDTQARFVNNLRLLALRTLLSQRELGAVGHALAELHDRAPNVVLEALGAIDVLTPLLVLQRGAGDPAVQLRAAVPTLLASLAGQLAAPVTWNQPVDFVVDRAEHRVLRFDPPARGVVAGGGSFRVVGGEGEAVVQPFAAIPPGPPSLQLSLFDSNPCALDEAHPDKHGNAMSLGGKGVDDWKRGLGAGLSMIEAALPDWFAELPASLSRIVPVGYHDEQHLSASYAEAPGLAYMTLHPNPLTLAEAIVHETQHSKLNTLGYFDDILENGATEWATSAVRPDLRPLSGVLLAVHAFAPVAAMHGALAELDHAASRDPQFARRRREVVDINGRGLATLTELAAPTEVGRRLLDGLRELHRFTAAALSA